MKKQSNISLLKELVNNDVLERVDLCTRGVQAFNLVDGEEYTVLVAYAKEGGRYYFICRDGRRFLASRYYRAEFVAGEMLDVIADERAVAMNAADQLTESGSVIVNVDILTLFFDECDRRKIKVTTSSAVTVDEFGRTFARYDLIRDDEPTDYEDNSIQSDNNNEDGEGKCDTLNMLRAAAKDVERLTESNEHTAALLTKLSVLAAIGLSVCSLIERTKAIEVAHGRGYLTPEEASERYQISQEAERKAALYLTPEEFRALYRHDPQTDSRAA